MNNEEWKYIEAIDDCLRDRLDLSFGNRIKLQMEKFVPVFVACGGRKEEAVDLQIARKVLRKLVNRFDAGLPEALKELENTLASKPAGWQELREQPGNHRSQDRENTSLRVKFLIHNDLDGRTTEASVRPSVVVPPGPNRIEVCVEAEEIAQFRVDGIPRDTSSS